jgi:steroid delta-isomerase
LATPEQTRAAVDAYAAAWRAHDRDAFVAVFAGDAVTEDPVPSPPNHGHAEIGAFWDRTHALADHIDFDPVETVVCGTEAVLRARITARSGDSGLVIDVIDVFVVGDDGLVRTLKAYWDPAAVRPLAG